jgi:hypothetical protein
METPCAKTVEVLELLLRAGGDLRKKDSDGMTPFQYRQRFGDNVEHLRPIYEAWTPHRLLPRWTPSAFPLYIEGSSAFRDVIITLLLCLLRYRHVIPKEVVLRTRALRCTMWWWWPIHERAPEKFIEFLGYTGAWLAPKQWN